MNAQGYHYQLPPTSELTLYDVAPFIAMSLQSPSSTSGTTTVPSPMTSPVPSYTSQRDRLKSILHDVQSIFDDEEDLLG